MFKSKRIRTVVKEIQGEAAKAAMGESKSYSDEDVFGPKNQNEIDKTTGENPNPEISWSDYEKTIFTAEEIAAADAKVRARGLSWDEYEKSNYTPDEIAASDKRAAKMIKKIHAKRKRKQIWSGLFRIESENSDQR